MDLDFSSKFTTKPMKAPEFGVWGLELRGLGFSVSGGIRVYSPPQTMGVKA